MGWVDRWADRGSGSPGPGRSGLPAKRDVSGPPGYVWHCHFASWSGPIQNKPEQIHESLTALRHLVAGPGLPRLKGLVEPSPSLSARRRTQPQSRLSTALRAEIG